MQTQTIVKQAKASVTIGICATTEFENTIRLTNEILGLSDGRVNLLEILVATPNQQLGRDLALRDPRVVVLLEEKREGKVSALNKIIRRASGDILVLACADIRIARNAIPRLVKDLTNHPEWGAVDSIVELVNGSKLLMDRVSNLVWETNNATLDELDRQDRLGQITGNLVGVRRELIEKLPDVINDDAYLALRVLEQGFQVKRAYGARIWIGGPRTPADYLFQRSRVLQGHLELIQRFGKMPTTFEFQILPNPRRYLRLLVRTVTKLGHSYLPALILAGFLEFLSFQIAIFSSLTRRGRKPWRIVESTKQI